MLNRHVRLNMSQTALLLSPSLSHLRERQLQLPRPHILQSSNPPANAIGFTFKMYSESDHFHHLCCSHFSPSHQLLSPGLLLLVPTWFLSFYPCSPKVYSQHSSQRDPFKTSHSSAHNLHDVTPLLKILPRLPFIHDSISPSQVHEMLSPTTKSLQKGFRGKYRI